MKINHSKITNNKVYKYSKGNVLREFVDVVSKNTPLAKFGLSGDLGQSIYKSATSKKVDLEDLEQAKKFIVDDTSDRLKRQYDPSSKEVQKRMRASIEDADQLKGSALSRMAKALKPKSKIKKEIDLKSKIAPQLGYDNVAKSEMKGIGAKDSVMDYTIKHGDDVVKESSMGLAYGHDPLLKQSINSDLNPHLLKEGVTADTDALVGVGRNLDNIQEDLLTAVHELSHLLQLKARKGETLSIDDLKRAGIDVNNPKEMKMLQSVLDKSFRSRLIDFTGYSKLVEDVFTAKDIKLLNNKLRKQGVTTIDAGYYLRPVEVQSRIQEIRYIINPEDPWKKITEKDMRSITDEKGVPTGGIFTLIRFAKALDKMPEFLNLINKYWVIGAGTGVAAGVAYGASEMENIQSAKRGGKIIYKNNYR